MKLNVAVQPDRFTHEGAPAKRISWEEQLERSVTASLLWEDSFYEDGQEIGDRIREAAGHCSKEFVRDLAIRVRRDHGIRHAPLWLAVSLLSRGGNMAGDTIAGVISRADELAEVLSMYWKDGKRPLSAQLKRGLAKAFGKFEEYHFAKYNRDGAVKLRDVMFLCHPKPKDEAQAALFKRIAENTLAIPDTWEVALSGGADKKETFTRLLAEGKLGYLATLRNLRNMVEAGVDAGLIRDRLLSDRGRKGILPFQFISAAKAVPSLEGVLDQAMRDSLEVGVLRGKTVVLLDNSGSMSDPLSGRSMLNRRDAAVGLGLIAIGMAQEARCFVFGTSCGEIPARASLALGDAVANSQHRGGTYLGAAVKQVERSGSFDRIIVLTDEQSHDTVPVPSISKKYMVNLAPYRNGVGYRGWTHIDGFSEKTLRYIAQIERDTDSD